MLMENPVAGQRCVHIHATLDTSLLTAATGRYAGGADHLANMMVFQDRTQNTHAKHTSLQAQRQGSGMATKAVCNLNLVDNSNLQKLTFLGVTRDHMLNGEDAMRHPASAGMFAVCIDGVVTIRAPWNTAGGAIDTLLPGDYLGIHYTGSGRTKTFFKGNVNDNAITTLQIRKLKGEYPNDPKESEQRVLYQNGGTTSIDLYDELPIGRLVEWRSVPKSQGSVYEFRVNLCPFGPSYEMLDSGLNAHNPATGDVVDKTDYQNPNSRDVGTDIKNGPGTFGLTWFDISAVQPTKTQARTPAKQAFIGTVLEQTTLGSSMAAQAPTASQAASPSVYNSLDHWQSSSHYQEMTSSAQKALLDTATKASTSQSVHLLVKGSSMSVEPIKNATEFRRGVLPNCVDQYDIKHDGKTVSVYVGVQTPTSSSASARKLQKTASMQMAPPTIQEGMELDASEQPQQPKKRSQLTDSAKGSKRSRK